MNNTEMQISPLSNVMKETLLETLGIEYKAKVTFYSDSPKGLLKGGKLVAPAGSLQKILIYGSLTSEEQERIWKVLFHKLAEVRSQKHAPVVVEFFEKELFAPDKSGGASRVEQVPSKTFTFPSQ